MPRRATAEVLALENEVEELMLLSSRLMERVEYLEAEAKEDAKKKYLKKVEKLREEISTLECTSIEDVIKGFGLSEVVYEIENELGAVVFVPNNLLSAIELNEIQDEFNKKYY